MAELYFADLVREASWTTGAGDFALSGAVAGYRRFADTVPPGAVFHYCIAGITRPGEWEVGEGTLGSGNSLLRVPIASSAGPAELPGRAEAVAFSPGLKTVTLTVAADWFARKEQGVADIGDVAGLGAALAAKADAVHAHASSEVDGLAAALAGKAAALHAHAPADIDGLEAALSAKAAATHGHASNDIAGLESVLAGKAAAVHGHGLGDVAGLEAALAAKAAAAHGHGQSDVVGLTAALDAKAAASHGHAISEVSGLTAALDGKSPTGHGHVQADVAGLAAALDAKAAAAHGHAVSEVSGLSATLDGKAALASPVFTGVPAAPTPAAGTNTAQIATTAFVRAEVSALAGTAPAMLDTLGEIAAALGNDANYAATVSSALAGKQPLDPELTAIAGLASAADRLPYFNGAGSAGLAIFTAAGRALVDDADAAAQRTTLGLGSAAVKAIGTSGDAVPVLGGGTTSWAAGASFGGDVAATGEIHSSGRAVTAKGQWSGLTGNGVTAFIDVAAGVARFGAYNVAAAWQPLDVIGSAVTVKASNVAIAAFTGTGVSVTGNVEASGTFRVSGTKVVGARVGGWVAATGTATRSGFDTATATTVQLAERLKALIDDLTAHGLIGS